MISIKPIRLLVLCVWLCVFSLPKTFASILYKDGAEHNVDYGISERLFVFNSPSDDPTTVNFLVGMVTNLKCQVFDDSVINNYGGALGSYLTAWENSQITVSGGSVDDWFRAYDSSHVTISGGYIEDLDAFGSSRITVSAGSIRTLDMWDDAQATVEGGLIEYGLNTYWSSHATVLAGIINLDVKAGMTSQITVLDGLIGNNLMAESNSHIIVKGGSIVGDILAGNDSYSNSSVITFLGSNFAIDGVPVDFGQYFAGDYASGHITGTLANGDLLDNDFFIYDNASIELVIPEPATFVLFGLGGVALLRKKKNRRGKTFNRSQVHSKPIFLFLTCLLTLGICQQDAFSVVYFDDGLVHDIDYEVSEMVLAFDNISGNPTTVNVLTDGWIKYYLDVYDHSRINVAGGSVYGVPQSDAIMTNHLWAHDNSEVTVSAGKVKYLYARDNSHVTVSGGTVYWPFGARDNSTVDISGGSFYGLDMGGDSRANISGGLCTYEYEAWANSIITFVGSSFAIDGVPVDFGQYFPSDYASGHLTGTLDSGDLLDNDFYIHNNASIVLVPEPATVALLGLGTLFLIRIRKRRK